MKTRRAEQRTSDTRFDVVLDALSNVYRRRLLLGLLTTTTLELSDDGHALSNGEDDPGLLQQELFGVHLPRLAEAEFVEWKPGSRTVRPGERFEEVAPLLRLIDAHADELPEGWL
jgi:hypothetical protein